jgi:hypothetical protein
MINKPSISLGETVFSGAGETVSRSVSLRGRYLSTFVWLVPVGLAAVYLTLFVVELPHNIWTLGWNSDFASGFTIPTTVVKTGTGGHTVLGYTGAYVPLWFGLLTAILPLHRQLWEIVPTGLLLVTALAVGWSVAQVANRRAAILAVLMILVAAPRALYLFMAAVSHNVVYPGTALLGAYLVWLAREDERGRVKAFVVPLLASVALGVCVASDFLLVVTGVAPLAVTAILAGLRRGRHSTQVAVDALTTAVVAVPIAKITSTIMGAQGYVTLPLSTKTASLSTFPLHAELMWEGLKQLFNGYLGPTTPGTLHTELGVACDVIVVVALITLLVVGTLTTVRFVWSGLRNRTSDATPRQLATLLHVVYWTSSAVLTCIAFSLSTRTDSPNESYYATLIFSVAAIIPLLLRPRFATRWLIPVGVSVFFTASLVGLTNHYMDVLVKPISHYVPEIVNTAKANHVKVGYAGYWEASSLTWTSREQVLVRPAGPCENPTRKSICAFPLATVPSWYAPTESRTFLLLDSDEVLDHTFNTNLGRPIATYSFGPLQMYIYPYDIASSSSE